MLLVDIPVPIRKRSIGGIRERLTKEATSLVRNRAPRTPCFLSIESFQRLRAVMKITAAKRRKLALVRITIRILSERGPSKPRYLIWSTMASAVRSTKPKRVSTPRNPDCPSFLSVSMVTAEYQKHLLKARSGFD